jgi:hypothetical protein
MDIKNEDYIYIETDQTKSICVSYRIRSDMEDPNNITKSLGISPTACYRKGDKYLGRNSYNKEKMQWDMVERVRAVGIWRLEKKSDQPSIHEIGKVIDTLLSTLEPNKLKIARYLAQKEKYQVNFSVWVESSDEFGRMMVNNDLLLRMAKLCHYVEFTTQMSLEKGDGASLSAEPIY